LPRGEYLYSKPIVLGTCWSPPNSNSGSIRKNAIKKAAVKLGIEDYVYKNILLDLDHLHSQFFELSNGIQP
jgi:hypothetical protein